MCKSHLYQQYASDQLQSLPGTLSVGYNLRAQAQELFRVQNRTNLCLMTPEELAREKIDELLEECGWILQDFREMNLSAGSGIAVREFQLSTGKADYLLYVAEKAIGVVEAKPEGHALKGVE